MDPQQLPLRDYQLPEPVSWWPPAPGWWVLLAILFLLFVAGYFFVRSQQRRGIKKAAKQELRCIQENRDIPDIEQLGQVSVLLRRVCVSVFHRNEVAGLTGLRWLEFLDRFDNGKRFSEGPGRILIEAPYQRDVNVDLQPLFTLCDQWINALPTSRPGFSIDSPSKPDDLSPRHD